MARIPYSQSMEIQTTIVRERRGSNAIHDARSHGTSPSSEPRHSGKARSREASRRYSNLAILVCTPHLTYRQLVDETA